MSAVGAYLAKKGWNPGNRKNVEDVWKREQHKKEEEKKLAELRKEYEEERNKEALESLQVQAGVKKGSSRLEWMYAGAPTSKDSELCKLERAKIDAQEREAFLLGNKPIQVAPSLKVSKLAKPDSAVAANALSAHEQFIRMQEDPLALQHQVLKRQKEEAEAKERKRLHKEKKEEKKRKRSKPTTTE